MLSKFKNIVLDAFFPPACLTCNRGLRKDERYQLVCGECFVNIPLYNGIFCSVCLKRVAEKECHPEALYLLAAAADYNNDRIQKLLWQMKYKNWLTASEPLANLLTAYWHGIFKYLNMEKFKEPWLVVPVPLFPKRELQRGFNQAAILANVISKRFFLPLEKNNLVRVKDTRTQMELKDYMAREKNVAGAFQVMNNTAFKKKNIILVDDVFTSGATLNEAARVLRSAGAKKILALVLARAR